MEETGWCYPCSGVAPPVYCEGCGNELQPNDHTYCSRCKYLRWLERNADEIERVMAIAGVSSGKAKQLVRSSNRPKCLCCGNPIKGGQKGKNFFCRKTKACRTGHNSYHYHRTKGDKDALQRAVIAATKERLINAARTRNRAA